MKPETMRNITMIESINTNIASLKDMRDELYSEVLSAEGKCPHCANWHYPHCEVAEKK